MVQTAGCKVCPVKLHFVGFYACSGKVILFYFFFKDEDGVKQCKDSTQQQYIDAGFLPIYTVRRELQVTAQDSTAASSPGVKDGFTLGSLKFPHKELLNSSLTVPDTGAKE